MKSNLTPAILGLLLVLNSTPPSAPAAPTGQGKSADPVHGLVELSRRGRVKPMIGSQAEQPGERVVFKDTASGATNWRMSRNPGYNRHQYSNVPVWNCDGSLLNLNSSGGTRRGYWLVAADGSRWTYFDSWPFQWSRVDPQIAYTVNMNTRELSAVNVATRKRRLLWTAPFDHMNGVVHQVWFIKRPDNSFMLNYESRGAVEYKDGQFLCEPERGGAIRKLDDQHFGHAGTSPDGTRVAHFRQGIAIYDLAKGENRFLENMPLSGGHLTWQVDSSWLAATFNNLIYIVWVDQQRAEFLCATNSQLGYYNYCTEAHLEASPDGTKIGYASSMLGDCDFYVAVRKLPDPPGNVRRSGDKLTWEPPEHSKELAGYYVYCDGKPTSRMPLRQTSLSGLKAGGQYVVTAVEHSGLESPRADRQAPAPPGRVKAAAIDAFSVKLTWAPSRDADVAYYNVYCGRGEVRPEQAYRVASATACETIDWGLQAGSDYRYQVTAVDRAGNESRPASAKVFTPAIQVVRQVVEVGRTLGGSPLDVTFALPRDGRYAVWLRLKPINAASQGRLQYRLDRSQQRWEPRWDVVTLGTGAASSAPFWDVMPGPEVGSMVHQLASGPQRLTLQSAGPTAEVQSLLVTNDLGYVPEGITSLLAPGPSRSGR